MRRKKRVRKSFCVVYGLYDHKDELRYIGQTRMILSDRFAYFYKTIDRKIRAGIRLSPVEKWIDEAAFFGMEINIKPIDENATWDVSEIIYIDRHRIAGANLLNVTRGGCDIPQNLPSFRKK